MGSGRACTVTLTVALAGAALAPGTAVGAGFCTGAISAMPKPGPGLRFGITPGVQTGQLTRGPVPPRTPEVPAKQLAAVSRLRAPGAPFVLRLHRLFWSDGEAGIRHFLTLARRYTRHDYLVELQLRYHPNARQEGDIPAWSRHVREVVDRFGPNRRGIPVQGTHQANFGLASASPCSRYARSNDALIP